ncbi:MAG: glycosyltransferase family 2 protein [Candidatus Daviesbacteria bacterium]|nr:glycosyltransferase family 2 protein [Candidatus Daviesbacteria bacterium]
MKKLTIATVTYNSLDYTKFFLENLRRNADLPYHLIVVDNHSTDGTAEFLTAQKDIEVVLNKRNLGFGQGNNQAFKRTKTSYFLGLNNDTFIGPGFLSKILDFADDHSDFAEFGVNSNCIGAKNPETGQEINSEILSLINKGQTPFEAVNNYYDNLDIFGKQFAKKNLGIATMEVPPDFIGGWCFLVRTDSVKKVGGLFDRRFKIGFWEDVDLSWRLALFGHKIGFIKEAYLHHFNHVSFRESKDKLRFSDKATNRVNSLKFAEKWSDQTRKILEKKLAEGMTLEEIIKKYHVFKVFFGIREDYSDLEKKLKTLFLDNQETNFKQLLLTKSSK